MLSFIFDSCGNEQRISLKVVYKNSVYDLGTRKHHKVLFILAKERAKHIAEGRNPKDQGYLYKDWLLETLYNPQGGDEYDPNLMNQHFSRFKQQLKSELNLENLTAVVEHHDEEVRFAFSDIKITVSDKVLYEVNGNIHSKGQNSPNDDIEHDVKVKADVKGVNNETPKHLPSILSKFTLTLFGLFCVFVITFWISQKNNALEEAYHKNQTNINSNTNSNQQPLVIGVLKVKTSGNSKTAHTAKETASSFKLALEFMDNQKDEIRFVDAASETFINYPKHALAHGINAYIEPNINCSDQEKCEFHFKYLTKNLGWKTKEALKIELPVKDSSFLNFAISLQIAKFMDDVFIRPIAPPSGVDSKSFIKFVNATTKVFNSDVDKNVKNILASIIKSFPHWDFARTVYLESLSILIYQEKTKVLTKEYQAALGESSNAYMNSLHYLWHKTNLILQTECFSNGTAAIESYKREYMAREGKKDLTLLETQLENFYRNHYVDNSKWELIVNRYPLEKLEHLSEASLGALQVAYWYLGKYQGLELILNRLLTISPNQPQAINTKTALLFKLAKHDEAISILKPLVEDNPDNAAYKTTLAANYESIGNWEHALNIRKENFDSKPTNHEAIWNYGRILYLMEEFNHADKMFEQLHAMIDESNYENQLLPIAWIYLATGNELMIERVLKQFEDNIENHKYSAMDALSAAELYALSNQKSGALKHIKSALSMGMSIKHFAQPQYESLCQYESFAELFSQENMHFCVSDNN